MFFAVGEFRAAAYILRDSIRCAVRFEGTSNNRGARAAQGCAAIFGHAK
jgi:hypothetical protein